VYITNVSNGFRAPFSCLKFAYPKWLIAFPLVEVYQPKLGFRPNQTCRNSLPTKLPLLLWSLFQNFECSVTMPNLATLDEKQITFFHYNFSFIDSNSMKFSTNKRYSSSPPCGKNLGLEHGNLHSQVPAPKCYVAKNNRLVL